MIYRIENMRMVWKSWGDGIIIWVFVGCKANFAETRPKVIPSVMFD